MTTGKAMTQEGQKGTKEGKLKGESAILVQKLVQNHLHEYCDPAPMTSAHDYGKHTSPRHMCLLEEWLTKGHLV